MREFVRGQLVPPERHFRWRGGEISRLEGFSDAVFAFAVTLLVVSLEVPKTYAELIASMKGFVAFAICFALLVQIWRQHYLYSRRYGLQTRYAIFLNWVLLFVVLFFVYPLKFLFTLSIGFFSRGLLAPDRRIFEIQPSQIATLEVIYSLGFAAVSTVFGLLYRYAYSKRGELELNEYELLTTRSTIAHCGVDVICGLLVACTAKVLPISIAPLAPLLFLLAGVVHAWLNSIHRRQEKRALEKIEAMHKTAPAHAGS
jgi:hypothetical protein